MTASVTCSLTVQTVAVVRHVAVLTHAPPHTVLLPTDGVQRALLI